LAEPRIDNILVYDEGLALRCIWLDKCFNIRQISCLGFVSQHEIEEGIAKERHLRRREVLSGCAVPVLLE